MKFKFFTAIGIPVFLLFVVFVQNAYAYIDPGTANYIYQLIIAAVIGGVFAVKLFWSTIILFFKNLFSKKPKQ